MSLRINTCFLLAACLALSALAARAQTVHVVTETTPNTFLQGGRVAGRATEVVELALQRAGIRDYAIDLYPWARALDIAQREPNVLIYLIARTPEREERFRWVGEIQRIRYFFFSLPDRADLAVKQLDDARGLTIGVVRDDVRQQYLQRQGFTRLVPAAQPVENLRRLLNRQVDLIVLTENEARRLCDEARPDCTGVTRLLPLDDLQLSLFMAYSRTTPEALAQRTVTAFESVRADGSLARIMGPSAPPPPNAGR